MNIWVPKFKIIEPQEIVLPKLGAEGRFRLQARRPNGEVRAETPWFNNLILNSGLDRACISAQQSLICLVGTGTAEPLPGDTALGAFLVSTSSVQSAARSTNSVSPYEMRKNIVYRFGAGVAEGNLTEVGVGWDQEGLWSRELIRDGAGVPTSFTVLADEFLDVTYELIVYPPLNDVSGQVTIGGIVTDFICRGMRVGTAGPLNGGWQMYSPSSRFLFIGPQSYLNITDRNYAYSGAIGPLTGAPAGTTEKNTGLTDLGYVVGNYYHDFSTSFNLGAANFGVGGIPAQQFSCGGASGVGDAAYNFQVGYTPAILKDDTKVLTTTFRTSIGRTGE